MIIVAIDVEKAGREELKFTFTADRLIGGEPIRTYITTYIGKLPFLNTPKHDVNNFILTVTCSKYDDTSMLLRRLEQDQMIDKTLLNKTFQKILALPKSEPINYAALARSCIKDSRIIILKPFIPEAPQEEENDNDDQAPSPK